MVNQSKFNLKFNYFLMHNESENRLFIMIRNTSTRTDKYIKLNVLLNISMNVLIGVSDYVLLIKIKSINNEVKIFVSFPFSPLELKAHELP